MFSTLPWSANAQGVWPDLPAETYHAAPGLSHSMTKRLSPPARLPVYLREKHEPTAEMIIGTLVHQRLLEPDRPLPRIALKPEGMKFSTTEGKQWREQHKHLLILTQVEWNIINGCVGSISRHPTCQQIFSKGHSEVSCFAWADTLPSNCLISQSRHTRRDGWEKTTR